MISRYIQVLVPRLIDALHFEIDFPDEELCLLYQGTIPDFPNAIGSLDFSIHRIRQPEIGEWRFFRGDKHCHFINNLSISDITKVFLTVEPGYAGRMADSRAFELSQTFQQLEERNVQVLVDGGFHQGDNVIQAYEDDENTRLHKQNRAVVENSYRQIHDFQSTMNKWRHPPHLEPFVYKLAVCFHNFLKRMRMHRLSDHLRERAEDYYGIPL